MKFTVMIFLTLVAFDAFNQTLNYTDVASGKAKGTFTTYISKNGETFQVGDTLKISSPSGVNGLFVNIESMDIVGNRYQVAANSANTNAVLKKIRVGGSKRAGWKVAFQTQGFTSLDNFFFFIEDALASGEIRSLEGMGSNEALEALKTAKDKLDLGLISQEEYDALKIQYGKFIK